MGSRDGSTPHQSLNIVTILKKSNTRHPGIEQLYSMLSESAHPNYEGTCIGYSKLDREDHTTTFSNRWAAMYRERHIEFISLCITLFYGEYNEEWSVAFEQLEAWIEKNDSQLEATKRDA